MKARIPRLIEILIVAALALAACGKKQAEQAPPEAQPAADPVDAAAAAIKPEAIIAHIKVLSSDEFGGRFPGSKGEELSVAYITDQFKKLGLAPGNPDGSYVQQVPLVGITGTPSGYFTAGKKEIELEFPKDAVAVTERVVPEVDVKDSDLVFVGYGVVAPEYGWDDYKGVDVKGKTIVMLVNDPPVPDPNDPSKLDDKMFKGRAMTYYGRWTYKYEIASQKGAAAAVIVHQTGPAGYPWEVVANSWSGENFGTAAENRNMDKVPVEAWITLDKARELFKAAGQDFDALYPSAASKDFKPVPLKAKATFHIDTKTREVTSHNVLAKLPGSDPRFKDEYIVYTAHWDHLGRKPNVQGDNIFNGAVDNASGVSGLIEIARAFTKVEPKPKRSILFLSVTGEEQGLLGSQWYVTHPLYPLAKTLADINMDSLNVWGPTRDIEVIGVGQSTLEDLMATAAQRHGRYTEPESDPEKGYYYRSDHFEFAKAGVPALYAEKGVKEFIGKPPGWGEQKRQEYIANDYHKPSDEVKPGWDLSGTAQDLGLMFEVGYRVAQSPMRPEWKEGSEFKARRDEMLKGASAQ